MNDATPALQAIVGVSPQYDASVVGPDTVSLGKLGLFVRVHRIQVVKGGNGAVFIALFDATTDRARSGMCVTCVGLSSDTEAAATEAAGHWCLGVLPVLAHWRGDHSCLVGTVRFDAPGRAGPLSFDVVKGPVIERGEHDGGEAALPSTDTYLSLLSDPLRAARLKSKPHWLECFAIRQADDSIDATCRLDNKDWSPGKKLLMADAGGWLGRTPSYHSRRQFLLLLPQGGGAEETEPRSFWARLFGRG
jgi:hypothetical protein